MALGVYNSTLGVSEAPVSGQAPGSLVLSVPTSYAKAQGQMDFLKRSTGDILVIGVCGKKPGLKNYDIILTDAIPQYSLSGIALGDITVLSSVAAGGIISITIWLCTL